MNKIPFWLLLGVLSSTSHVVRAQEDDTDETSTDVVVEAAESEPISVDDFDPADPRSTLGMLKGKPKTSEVKQALDRANAELSAVKKRPSGEETAKAQALDLKNKGINLLLKDLDRKTFTAMNSESRLQNLHAKQVEAALQKPDGALAKFFEEVEAYKKAKAAGDKDAKKPSAELAVEVSENSPLMMKTMFSVDDAGNVQMSHEFEVPEDRRKLISQSVSEKLNSQEVRDAIEHHLNVPVRARKVELIGTDADAITRALSSSHNKALLGTSDDGDQGALLASKKLALEETDINNVDGAAGQNHLTAQNKTDQDQRKNIEASIKLLNNRNKVNASADDCVNLTNIVGKKLLAGDTKEECSGGKKTPIKKRKRKLADGDEAHGKKKEDKTATKDDKKKEGEANLVDLSPYVPACNPARNQMYQNQNPLGNFGNQMQDMTDRLLASGLGGSPTVGCVLGSAGIGLNQGLAQSQMDLQVELSFMGLSDGTSIGLPKDPASCAEDTFRTLSKDLGDAKSYEKLRKEYEYLVRARSIVANKLFQIAGMDAKSAYESPDGRKYMTLLAAIDATLPLLGQEMDRRQSSNVGRFNAIGGGGNMNTQGIPVVGGVGSRPSGLRLAPSRTGGKGGSTKLIPASGTRTNRSF